VAIGASAPAVAQQAPGAAAGAQGAQPSPGAEQPRRGGAGGNGGGGGGGRPQTQPLGDGPWDVTTEQARIHVTVVTKQLQNPWGLQFLPNGDMLVTERPGRLRVVRGGVLDPAPLEGMPTIRAASIGGLQDVVLHPDFRRNQLVYFSYSKPDAQDEKLSSLAVARGRFDDGGGLKDVEDIFVAKDWYSAAM